MLQCIVLLLVVRFEFELKCLSCFQKMQNIFLPHPVFQPGPTPFPLLFPFSFLPPARPTLPRPVSRASPAALPFSSPVLSRRQVGSTCRGLLPRREGPGLSRSPPAPRSPRLPWPARRGLVPALFKCRATPLEPFFEAAAASCAKP